MSSARRTSVSPRGTHRSGSLSPRNGPAKVFSGASLVVGGALDTPPPFASPSRPRQRSKASSSIQSPGQLQPSLHAARRTPSSPRASISKLGPLTGSLDAKDLSVADYIVDSSPIVYDASPAGGGGPGVPMETGAVRRSSPAPYASLGSSGVTSPILSGRKESAVSMSTPPVYPAGRIPSGGGGAILPPGARRRRSRLSSLGQLSIPTSDMFNMGVLPSSPLARQPQSPAGGRVVGGGGGGGGEGFRREELVLQELMLAPLTPRTLSSLATASSSEGGFGPGARIDARAPRLSSSALDIDFPVSVTSHHSFKFAVSGGSDADQGDAFDDSFGEQALGSDVGVLPSGTRGTPVQTRKVTVSAIAPRQSVQKVAIVSEPSFPSPPARPRRRGGSKPVTVNTGNDLLESDASASWSQHAPFDLKFRGDSPSGTPIAMRSRPSPRGNAPAVSLPRAPDAPPMASLAAPPRIRRTFSTESVTSDTFNPVDIRASGGTPSGAVSSQDNSTSTVSPSQLTPRPNHLGRLLRPSPVQHVVGAPSPRSDDSAGVSSVLLSPTRPPQPRRTHRHSTAFFASSSEDSDSTSDVSGGGERGSESEGLESKKSVSSSLRVDQQAIFQAGAGPDRIPGFAASYPPLSIHMPVTVVSESGSAERLSSISMATAAPSPTPSLIVSSVTISASGGPTVTVATPTSVVLKPSPRHRTLSSYVVSSVSEEPDDDGDGETPQPLAGAPALIPSLPPKAVGTDVLSSLLQAATAAVEDASLVAGEQARFHAQAVDDEPRSLATTFTNVGDVLFIGPDLDVEQTPAVQLDSTEAYTMTQREAFVPSASLTTMGGTTLHRTDLPFRVAFAATDTPNAIMDRIATIAQQHVASAELLEAYLDPETDSAYPSGSPSVNGNTSLEDDAYATGTEIGFANLVEGEDEGNDEHDVEVAAIAFPSSAMFGSTAGLGSPPTGGRLHRIRDLSNSSNSATGFVALVISPPSTNSGPFSPMDSPALAPGLTIDVRSQASYDSLATANRQLEGQVSMSSGTSGSSSAASGYPGIALRNRSSSGGGDTSSSARSGVPPIALPTTPARATAFSLQRAPVLKQASSGSVSSSGSEAEAALRYRTAMGLLRANTDGRSLRLARAGLAPAHSGTAVEAAARAPLSPVPSSSPPGLSGAAAFLPLGAVAGSVGSSGSLMEGVSGSESSSSSSLHPRRLSTPVAWKRGTQIGEGSFGKVYRGMNSLTGELFAVKELPIERSGQQEQNEVVRELMREISLLASLEHPHIVRYIGTQRSPDKLFLFTEYITGGSLSSILSEFGRFTEEVIAVYTRQVLHGLAYLHNRHIIHRDIKGANILITNTGVVKLADFGCSKTLNGISTPTGFSLDASFKRIRGTIPFMAPEVIRQTGHGRKSDIWSVGCVVLEMATGSMPWSQFSNKLTAMFHIATSGEHPPIPDHLSAACKSFLSRCFVQRPEDRASADELLKDPWLEGVRIESAQELTLRLREGSPGYRPPTGSSAAGVRTPPSLYG